MQTPQLPDSAEAAEAVDALARLTSEGLGEVLTAALIFVGVALVLYLVLRLARRWTASHVEEVNTRHRVRKWLGYAYGFLLVLLGVGLFADVLLPLGAFLAILLAALAVALQDVLKAVVGWMFLNTRAGVSVGSRVEVEGVRGDVIDIGMLKTTMLEVGNLVYGQQSTGRLVTVPNYKLLTESTFISAADNLFVWQEVQMVVTFESDWKAARSALRAGADELHEEVKPELEAGHRRMEERYAYKHGLDTPIVYVSVADHGVELTVRYLTHVRRRRGTIDRISRGFLEFVDATPTVELAYPTWRIYRAGEEAEGAAIGGRRGPGG